MTRLLLLLLMALAWIAPVRASTSVWVASEDDYILLSPQLARLTLSDSVQGYRTPGGSCLILADAVRVLEFPIMIDEQAGTADGWFISEDRRFHLDHRGARVMIGDRAQPIAKDELRETPQGLCVEASALARWWGLSLVPDLREAVLAIRSTVKLPVEQAVERRARQAKLRRPAVNDLEDLPHLALPYSMARLPTVDVVAGANFRNDDGDKSRLDRRYELYASSEIARLSTDVRLASDDDGVPATLRMRAYRKSTDGDLLGPMRATIAAAGDVTGYASALVNQPTAGRGFLLSNQPLDRPQTFDRTDFRGELPQGWDAELYRNGQLLGFAESRSDGRYEFLDVPLLYGLNQFEVVLYGPQGQIRRERRPINVGATSLQPGQTTYWFGAIQDHKDLITIRDLPRPVSGHPLRASGVVAHGIDKLTSISLQMHSFELNDDRLTYVEGSVRRSVGPALLEANAAATTDGGTALQLVGLGQFGRTYVSGESLWARGFASDRVERGVTSRHRIEFDQYFAIGEHEISATLGASYTDWRNRTDELVIANRISTRLARLALTHELNWQHYGGAGGPDPPDRIEGALLVNTMFGPLRLRGEGRYRLRPEAKFDYAAIVGEWAVSERAEWRAEVGYEHLRDRARFAIGHSHIFDALSVGGRVEAATDGSYGFGINLAMSIGPDPRNGGLRLSHRKLAATGQVMARVFTDENGNNSYDAGEEMHSNVGLNAGSNASVASTKVDGRAIIDGLPTFQPWLISIDTASIEDPYLQPASSGIVVTPRPGTMAQIDLPLLRAGEVEGMLKLVRTGGATMPFGGVDLELVGATGKAIASTRSEYDGFFLFTGVPYGRYEVRIGAAAAARLRLPAGPIAAVGVTADEPVANAGDIAVDTTPVLVSALPEDKEVTAGTVLTEIDVAALNLIH